MQAIEAFERRCMTYQGQEVDLESTVSEVYMLSHKVVYTALNTMLPEHPPSVNMLGIIIKDVCQGASPYTDVFEQIAVRYVHLVGDAGISSQVIFYYVSNAIISLLVLSRQNSQLSTDILLKMIQRFNFRDTILRAGIEVIAEEVLRRCFATVNEARVDVEGA